MSDGKTSVPTIESLYETQGAGITRYIGGLVGNSAEAEDIAQETFLRAHSRLVDLRDPDKVVAWLYRIATDLSHDHFRRSSGSRPALSLDAAEDGAGDEPIDPAAPRLDQLIEQGEMSACVREYLDGLGDDYRAAVMLHDVEGMTSPEIAAMLDCSTGAVKIRLHRARFRLKAALDEACLFSRDDRGVFVCDRRPDEKSDEQ